MTLKRTADLLTLIRLIGALVLPVIGLIQGPVAVAGAGGWLFLLLWLSDFFDGRLARKSGYAGEGFFGKNEGWIDLLLAASGFTLLFLTGFVSPWVWVAALFVTLILTKVDFLVFQGIITFGWTALYFVIAVRQDPVYLVGVVLLGGIGLFFFHERLVVLWKRFFDHIRRRTIG